MKIFAILFLMVAALAVSVAPASAGWGRRVVVRRPVVRRAYVAPIVRPRVVYHRPVVVAPRVYHRPVVGVGVGGYGGVNVVTPRVNVRVGY